MEIPNINKKQIETLLENGKRLDGRKPFDYRDIEIEKNISKNAEGSARVRIGDTEVVAGVKMEVGEPFPDTPDDGTIMVDGVPRISTIDYKLNYKGKPWVIIPEWSLKPFSSSENYEQTIKDKMNIEGFEFTFTLIQDGNSIIDKGFSLADPEFVIGIERVVEYDDRPAKVFFRLYQP